MPYWTVFGTETFRAGLETYLDTTDPFDEIRVILFNHGTESIGLADAEAWQRTAARARKVGVLTGADATAYPRDFAALVRSHRALDRVRPRYPLPLPLGADDVVAVLTGRDEIGWEHVR
ncbi:hypothetical protein [Streptomyces sp. NPDC002676]